MHQRMSVVLLLLALIPACGDTPTTHPADEEDSAALMAAALDHLVSEDHTFGEGPPPFRHYLIEERSVIVEGAPPLGDSETDLRRMLTEQERLTIEGVISQYGPVRWITDPDDWRTEELDPRVEDSAILGVGLPRLDEQAAFVPVSLWCGGDCGTWLTYRLERTEDGWQVVGIEGPMVVS